MNDREAELYRRIYQFPLDNPEAMYPLSTKLAWEYYWNEVFTLRAIHEYKKAVRCCINLSAITKQSSPP